MVFRPGTALFAVRFFARLPAEHGGEGEDKEGFATPDDENEGAIDLTAFDNPAGFDFGGDPVIESHGGAVGEGGAIEAEIDPI